MWCRSLATCSRRYRITKIKGDRYAGEWPREQFLKRGIKYEPSKDPKGAIYLNLLPMLNSGKVKLLGNRRLAQPVDRLERNTSRGGKDSIDHPRGGHDDLANACAGALLFATAKRPQIFINGRTWEENEAHMARVRARRRGQRPWHDPPNFRFVTVSEQDIEKEGIRLK